MDSTRASNKVGSSHRQDCNQVKVPADFMSVNGRLPRRLGHEAISVIDR